MNVRETYVRDRLVMIPAFLSPENVVRLERAAHGLPSRRVTVRSHRHTEWDELDVTGRAELTQVFKMNRALDLVQMALSVSNVAERRVVCWANRYRVGEHIAPHCDKSGTVQLIVSLKAPISELNGGVLHLNLSEGARAYSLAPGDAVLWEATTVEHWTTPLVSTPDERDPERLVLVGRYFL